MPATSVCGGTDFVTTERVATTECAPISTPGNSVASAASHTKSSRRTAAVCSGHFEPDEAAASVRILVEAATTAGTGVEMEALCGASAAALTIYDMGKAVERGITIDGLRLLRKEGGRSGVWVADADEADEVE